MIGLDAPSITIRATARLVANGGGGGGGASTVSTMPFLGNGQPGASADPISGTYPFPARGGTYGSDLTGNGGGGADGLDTTNGSTPGGNGCSAGGGGGALGVIRAYTGGLVNESMMITPMITVVAPL
jgi:hypothetical protein